MFRSDRDALAQEVEDLRAEKERLAAENEAMRHDLLARRAVPGARLTGNIYKDGVAHLGQGERLALARHSVESFPVWAAVVLHFLTFGLFSLIHFSRLHNRLPRAAQDDPTAGRAIGFSFIPYFHFYWHVFNPMRLADRINLQFRLRNLPDAVPRQLVVTAAVLGVIPYVNYFIGYTIVWPIAIAYLQRAVNQLAALPSDRLDTAEAEARAIPQVRVPAVADLPLPDAVAAQQQAAEQEAAEHEAAAVEAVEARERTVP